MRLSSAIFLTSGLLLSLNSFAIDEIKIEKKNALFSLGEQTLPLIRSTYVGWTGKWQWANTKVSTSSNLDSFTGRNESMDIDFKGSISQQDQQMTWAYEWDKHADVPDAIGFGIEYKFQLDSPTFPSKAQPPELLPDNQGWQWQTPNGESVTVKFSPAPAKLYFEKGQKSLIRALFFTDIKKGPQHSNVTISVNSKNKLEGSIGTKPTDLSQWHKNILDDTASPIDLSYLNNDHKPAGKHGILQAREDQLVFADGTAAKFWGTNVMANALYQSSDVDIEKHAKRLAQLGFNLVRIHHHDSKWVKPNIFKNPETDTQSLSEQSLQKLDLWIKCLKEQGIYVWLDLHVNRTFTEADGIDYFDEVNAKKTKKDGKGFSYLNTSIQQKMQAFNKAYLGHVNLYTKIAYQDDPAIISVLLTNENDLTQHYGNLFGGKNNYIAHSTLFNSAAKTFSETYQLPPTKTSHPWEMGPAKLFLNELEHRFNQTLSNSIRQQGYKSLLATTNSWGKMGIFGLPSLTDGNVIDSHSYGLAEELKHNPRFNPSYLAWIAGAQVANKPLSSSEWAIEPFAGEDRFTAPLYTASIASLQGWDAIMLYGYSQQKLGNDERSGDYSFFNDPSTIGLMPAAALIYRQGQVAPAKNNYQLQLPKNDFFYKRIDPNTSKTIRSLFETSRLTIGIPETSELPWLKSTPLAKNSIAITDPDKDYIPEGQNFVISDTGELKRDWEKGIHSIDTEKTQAVSGWLGGENIKLANASFSITTPAATISVQSLENKAIKDSTKIFITALAKAETTEKNSLPFLSEPISGTISFNAPEDLKLYPISNGGDEEEALVPLYQQGKYTIDLGKKPRHWYVLRK
ncbi:hypothetical protein JCM14076_01860 [Methylosoma difficile]